jgi:hypothetical protein
LPAEKYAFALQIGVDIPADRLAAMAHEAFDQLQREMKDHDGRSPQRHRGTEKNEFGI